ncbi:MAG: VanZ family protein [Phocaeicola sp.]
MQIYNYLKNYPLSIALVIVIGYLSFFTPPQTELSEINHFDKFAHIAMYGGLSFVLWMEYLRSHKTVNRGRLIISTYLLPFLLSGIIELLQAYCTENRSGEWFDLGANSLGILLAGMVGEFILRPFLHKKKSSRH